MPEIYADWKSLTPMTNPVPAGTRCVVIDRDEKDKFVLGEVVTVEEFDPIPYCLNTDGVRDAMRVIELALLPADYQAEPKAEQPEPAKPERKVLQIAANPLGVVALCSDGAIWGYSNVCGDWSKLPPIPQD